MTPDLRSELFATLAELAEAKPEWRLGQMVANLALIAGRLDPGGVWDLEDGEALEAARSLIRETAEQSSALLSP